MSTSTETVTGVGLTSEELKLLANLLKHPKIKGLAEEMKKEHEKSK